MTTHKRIHLTKRSPAEENHARHLSFPGQVLRELDGASANSYCEEVTLGVSVLAGACEWGGEGKRRELNWGRQAGCMTQHHRVQTSVVTKKGGGGAGSASGQPSACQQ